MHHTAAARIVRALSQAASPDVASRLRRYMKGQGTFLGLRQPGIETVYRAEVPAHCRGADLAAALLARKEHEAKCVGILTLRDCGEPAQRVLEVVQDAVAAGHIGNWAACDSLAMKVVKPILLAAEETPTVLRDWASMQAYPWGQRLACVGHVGVARRGVHVDAAESIAGDALRNEHRFVQLGAGWALRDVGDHDEARLLRLLPRLWPLMIREAARYAVEHLPPEERRAALAEHARARRAAQS